MNETCNDDNENVLVYILPSLGEWESLLSLFPFASIRLTSVLLISEGPRQVYRTPTG